MIIFLQYFFVLVLLAGCKEYHVGEGKTYTTIGAAMDVLEANSVVYIHYKATPYKEKFVVGFDNVNISGVCTESNDCPHIDGENAIPPSSQVYTNEDRGIIKIGTSNTPKSQCPKNIVIENLKITSARPPYKFTGNYSPKGLNEYTSNAAGVYIECAENAILRNLRIENNGNGIFAGIFDGKTKNLLIEKNYVHNNGISGSYLQHNLYVSSVGVSYQYNYFGALRTGCDGNNLKDRSAGAIIRYNWIQDGNRQLDLVELYDSQDASIRTLSTYNKVWVYGNILFESTDDGNRQISHFGGDSGSTSTYRKGPIYFHYNTIVSKRPDARTTLIRLSSNDVTAYFTNNVILSENELELLAEHRGKLYLSNNLITKGYIQSVEKTYDGVVSDSGTLVVNKEPGFASYTGNNFNLNGSSLCKNRAVKLSKSLKDYYPIKEYENNTFSFHRYNPLDIGAYASNKDYKYAFQYSDDDVDEESSGCCRLWVVSINILFVLLIFLGGCFL